MTAEFQPVLVVSMPNHPPRCFAFEGNQIQIGRGTNNHITLDDPAVSKTHCEFFVERTSRQWRFRDLGSTNGSELNGQAMGWEDALVVQDGDEIVLGKIVRFDFLALRQIETPESLEDEDPDVNPVAAAVARQGREDMEGTQLIRLKAKRK